MSPLTRRTFLATGTALGLGSVTPVAAAKPKTDDGTVRMKVTDAVSDSGLCHLPSDVASTVGVGEGAQIRLRYDSEPVVFTVVVHDDKFGAISPGGRKRLGATKNSFVVEPDAQVVHPTMDRETAAETGEFIERSISGSASAIAVAPHGGYIEYGTDHQAQRFADTLGATAWYCSGWWPGGGAYRRWHVTSTYLAPESFPVLDQLEETGFDTAVSFHGWGESHLAIGGTASLSLREALRDAIEAAVDGAFDVRLATDPTRDGTDPDNIVNWITATGQDGIQIEQPRIARDRYRDTIADCAVDVIEQHVA